MPTAIYFFKICLNIVNTFKINGCLCVFPFSLTMCTIW